MTATLLANNRATRDAMVPPPTLHEDGTPYSFRMFYDGGERIADSDSLDDLVAVLIDGYLDLDDPADRAEARFRFMKRLQYSLRVSVVAGISREAWDEMTSLEHALLNWDNEQDPTFSQDSGDGAPIIWKQEVPLILVDAHYEPIGALTPPLSSYGDHPEVPNVIMLRTTSDLEFLTSLNRTGFIQFGTPRAQYRLPAELRKE